MVGCVVISSDVDCRETFLSARRQVVEGQHQGVALLGMIKINLAKRQFVSVASARSLPLPVLKLSGRLYIE